MNRVAVIGAGAAGLCAARHLVRVGITPVIFEQRNCVGGQWAYEDVDRNNTKDVFSSMYDNLRTNLPKQVMCYPDFAFPDEAPSFMHYSTVNQYLEDYAKKFQLSDYIKFNTTVISVDPLVDEHNEDLGDRFVKWKIKYANNDEDDVEIFDGVMVCTGRYSVPNYPTIPGLENFHGFVLHSHYYRRPEDFKSENVLVLGAGPSGSDIIFELSKTAETVYYSHKGDRTMSELPSNVVELPNISYVTNTGEFVFENNETYHNIQSFIPCTGYQFKFNFLSDNCGLTLSSRIVENLYLHFVNIRYPSMVMIGLPMSVSPMPLMYQQSAFASNVFVGLTKLLTEDEMYSSMKNELIDQHTKGLPEKYFHKFGDKQFEYNDNIASLSGYVPNPRIFKTLYQFTWSCRRKDLMNYKNYEYQDKGNGDFDVMVNGVKKLKDLSN